MAAQVRGRLASSRCSSKAAMSCCCLVMLLCICRLPSQQQVSPAAAGQGRSSLEAAVQQAQAALVTVLPPARACSPALAPAAGPAEHTPDEEGWQQLLEDAVRVLQAGAAKTPGGVGVDTDMARQEFISGGQQVRGAWAKSLCGSCDCSSSSSSREQHSSGSNRSSEALWVCGPTVGCMCMPRPLPRPLQALKVCGVATVVAFYWVVLCHGSC